jgi:GTP-dependent phosphoenolpyruvate carboxykinase
VSPEDLATLLRVEVDGWLTEVPMIAQHFDQFGDHLPHELRDELRALKEGLESIRR